MRFESVDEARACCAKWQKILRLQDWVIDVRLLDRLEMDGDWGNVTRWPQKKRAMIRIADEGDEKHFMAFDAERTMVHELLHLHTMGFCKERDDDLILEAEEVCINMVAQALVDLDRRGPSFDVTALSDQQLTGAIEVAVGKKMHA